MTRRVHTVMLAGASIWLLLGPPFKDGKPVPTADLPTWKRYGTFATEDECAKGRELMGRMTGDGTYGWEKEYWTALARCVDTDAAD